MRKKEKKKIISKLARESIEKKLFLECISGEMAFVRNSKTYKYINGTELNEREDNGCVNRTEERESF